MRRQDQRYSPHYFHFFFVLFVIHDDHRYSKEVVDSRDGKI